MIDGREVMSLDNVSNHSTFQLYAGGLKSADFKTPA